MVRDIDPFGEFDKFQKYMMNMLRTTVQSRRVPRVDIEERKSEFVITAELPGCEKKDIEVRAEDDAIVIEAEVAKDVEQKEKTYYHRERSSMEFYRRIALPQGVDPERAKTTFKNGVLTIRVPQDAKKRKGKKLKVD